MPNLRVFLAIFAFALTVRVGLILLLDGQWGTDAFLIEDSSNYRLAAAAGIRQSDVMPAYIAFLRLFEALFGSDLIWPILGQAVIDSLTSVAIAGIGSALKPRLALPAGVMAALNPTQLVMASLLLTESLFLFFCTVSLWATLTWLRRPRWFPAIVVGVALGCGILTRMMLVPWALVLPLLLLAALVILRRPLSRAIVQMA
ncbi:MAG: glycosyltransferase family 39 protein, partial [Alphaproteobacteria bacterium]|nr:glycosyltransferase family 39 protein [Alphaproteobacteria bacterium]